MGKLVSIKDKTTGTQVVEAIEVRGDFSIHPTVGVKTVSFTVTHIPSGIALITGIPEEIAKTYLDTFIDTLGNDSPELTAPMEKYFKLLVKGENKEVTPAQFKSRLRVICKDYPEFEAFRQAHVLTGQKVFN